MASTKFDDPALYKEPRVFNNKTVKRRIANDLDSIDYRRNQWHWQGGG